MTNPPTERRRRRSILLDLTREEVVYLERALVTLQGRTAQAEVDDVRIILEDDHFERIFGTGVPYGTNPLWSIITTAISEYLQKRTGLPVDFQIQKQSEVRDADWKKPREPLGVFGWGTGRVAPQEDD